MADILSSESKTIARAQALAETLADDAKILIYGDLGAGKTVFARALIRALCHDETLEVPSPTFTLVQTYETPREIPIWHYDLYRLKDIEEIYELGWEEALAGGIVIVEWPERLGNMKPSKAIEIYLTNVPDAPEKRQIRIEEL